jgi:hypothetical protein
VEAHILSRCQCSRFSHQLGRMMTVFWDSQGPINEHHQECGITVTSAGYSDMSQNKLRPAIYTKWWGRLLKCLLFLHNNAWPHTAAHTRETLQERKFEVPDHPAYSLDLVPLDLHLFEPLKEDLRGNKFADDDDDEVKEAVHDWLSPNIFFWWHEKACGLLDKVH